MPCIAAYRCLQENFKKEQREYSHTPYSPHLQHLPHHFMEFVVFWEITNNISWSPDSHRQWYLHRLFFQSPVICSLDISWDRCVVWGFNSPKQFFFNGVMQLFFRPVWSLSIHNVLQEGAPQMNCVVPTCSVKNPLSLCASNLPLRLYDRWDKDLCPLWLVWSLWYIET